MDKLTIISGCLFLAADIFAIASVVNPDWINTGEEEGKNSSTWLKTHTTTMNSYYRAYNSFSFTFTSVVSISKSFHPVTINCESFMRTLAYGHIITGL